MSFNGIYLRRIDEKNRLSLPTSFFSELLIEDLPEKERLLYSFPTKNFIFYTNKDLFMKFEKSIDIPSITQRIDSSFRIILPNPYLDILGNEKSCYLIGYSNHFRLYNENSFENLKENLEKKIALF